MISLKCSLLIKKVYLCCLLLLCLGELPLFAKSVVTYVGHDKRVEIDWGMQSLNIRGEYKVEDGVAFSFSEAEGKTISAGLMSAREGLDPLYQNFLKRYNLSLGLEEQLREYEFYSHVMKSKVYSDKVVEVFSRAPLKYFWRVPSRFFTGSFDSHSFDDQQPTGASGVVFRFQGLVEPQVLYTLVNSDGDTLFSCLDLSYEVFTQHLTGRWYESPTLKEQEITVGKTPGVIDLHVVRDGVYEVAGDKKAEHMKSLAKFFREGKVMFQVKPNTL